MRSRGFQILFGSLLLSIGQSGIAASVTFAFEGHLVQAGNPVGFSVGDPFTGYFSYTLQQPGTTVPLVIPGQMTGYFLDSFSLTLGAQTVTSTGGRIRIANNNLPFPSSPSVVWDTVELGAGPNSSGSVSGIVNGFAASELLFSLVNINGQPFSDTSLPGNLSLSDFPASRQAQVLFANGGGAVIGEVTSLQLIPEPGASSLLVFAGVTLVTQQRKRAGWARWGRAK